MKMENEDLLFIKKFNKIAIDKICKELGYNTGNICYADIQIYTTI